MRQSRYERNGTSINEAENSTLSEKRVCVLGLGGLGGYIAETLARVGVLHLTLIDCDAFDETNLNRQIFCTESSIGKRKAAEAEKRLKEVNTDVCVNAIDWRLNSENAQELLKGHDIVMDALDSVETRKTAAKACARLGIPFVHGAIGGWYGQVAVIMPGSRVLDKLYNGSGDNNIDKSLGNLPFTAAHTASLQCAEAIKLLLGKGDALTDSFIRVDLLHNEFDVITL